MERVLAALDYDPETGIFRWKVAPAKQVKAGSIAGNKNVHGYVCIKFEGKLYRAHRLAFHFVHGRWPTPECDHINRVRDDNRAVNLREATKAENGANRGANRKSLSGHKGVAWDARTQKWRVSRAKGGVTTFLGYHQTLETAVAASAAFDFA